MDKAFIIRFRFSKVPINLHRLPLNLFKHLENLAFKFNIENLIFNFILNYEFKGFMVNFYEGKIKALWRS